MLIKYLRQVLRHKYFVFVEAYKLGIPWLGLIHDLSKFTPSEFFAYARNFYGDYPSYRNASEPERSRGHYQGRIEDEFDIAWNEHQKRNKHHWQRWVLINDSSEPQIRALLMPDRYFLEMIADWRGAGRAYGNPDTYAWYKQHESKHIMHVLTRAAVEYELGI